MKSDPETRFNHWLFRISTLYLIIPFLIFCLGFMHLYISLPLTGVLIIIIVRLWRGGENGSTRIPSRKEWTWLLLISTAWVLLSGIGGFAFQNFDFNGRNATLRDLINYSWPVFYTTLGSGTFAPATHSLVYYFGYWLVPALIGKLLGWQAANVVLFVYTLLGVLLTVLLLSRIIKTGLIRSLLLLVFFSGMDIFGVLIDRNIFIDNYPTLWPPITHLEWWQLFQFSSFTTQLFWVFNQTLPVWICAALILNQKSNRYSFLLWSLSFFFAPMPALGLAVILIGRFLNGFIFAETSDGPRRKQIIQNLRDWLSLENLLGGGVIALISYLFFSSNSTVSTTRLVAVTPAFILAVVVFSLLEWFLLWLYVSRFRKTDVTWYLIAPALTFSLFLNVSDVFIISRRATVALLFLLMIWVGKIIYHEKSRVSFMLAAMLIIGAFTPLYEINRSIYRTISYYTASPANSPVDLCALPQQERLVFPSQPELDHPDTLTADDWCSLATFDFQNVTHDVADVSESFFFKYLAKK